MLALSAIVCSAGTLYSNADPASDQMNSIFFSTGYTEIGDQLQLTSGGYLTSVETQFYNLGSDATFDAVLSFYLPGAPVGAQIGGSFTVTGFIASGESQTITFANLGNLWVPAEVIATLSVLNVSADGDIGVNLFDPPTVGSSDNTFFIVNTDSGFSQLNYSGIDNLYFVVNGADTPVPEPATAALMLGAFAGLVCFKYRAVGFQVRKPVPDSKN